MIVSIRFDLGIQDFSGKKVIKGKSYWPHTQYTMASYVGRCAGRLTGYAPSFFLKERTATARMLVPTQLSHESCPGNSVVGPGEFLFKKLSSTVHLKIRWLAMH
jgi:hypothetical protein